MWRFLKKLKIEVPYDPAIPLLVIYTKKMKSLSGRDIYTFWFIATLLTTAKTWKQPKCLSVDEWIKKMWDVYNGILFSHEKERNPANRDNLDET